jgi:hypothetical protein
MLLQRRTHPCSRAVDPGVEAELLELLDPRAVTGQESRVDGVPGARHGVEQRAELGDRPPEAVQGDHAGSAALDEELVVADAEHLLLVHRPLSVAKHRPGDGNALARQPSPRLIW